MDILVCVVIVIGIFEKRYILKWLVNNKNDIYFV